VVKLLDEVVLSFERAGILSLLPIREGDQVHEGQLVAMLKDDVARAALAVAEQEASSDVDIRFAQKASEVAQAEYDKIMEANRRFPGTVPDVEVRRARLAADKTVLEIEKATHTRAVHLLKRDEAAVQLETYKIEAPFDGFVTRVHFSKGASVRPGDSVIELVSTKRVRVEGYVAVSDLGAVRPGSKVSVRLESPDTSAEGAKISYPGKIVFVDVKSRPVEHTVRVWAEVENLENMLRAGLTPSMTILPPAND
ncbi:MAG TPA: HlyD family efflux transporter periplasmic adaptor subunit, partial [Planctomycetaceae bacterium]|nr:HlyD family efflux transporter periplasmic adaptor subunit [Planctomycetaceae bacterium]